MRGYDGALLRVTRALEDELGFSAAGASAARRGGRRRPAACPAASRRSSTSRCGPEQRADSAATALLVHLLGTIEQNLPGTLADVDSEFLHDLRVAVRRTRSAQRQLRGVFPPEPLARFRAEFRWLQQVTGPTRDLDVHLLEFDELALGAPRGAAADLEPLRALLRERRRREQRRMVRALRSARFDALLADWAVFLEGARRRCRWTTGRTPRGRSSSSRASGSRASTGAWSRRASAIDDASPAERLHDLRKTGKELRYLLEFFAALFPDEVVKPMVRTLKALQDTLGRF